MILPAVSDIQNAFMLDLDTEHSDKYEMCDGSVHLSSR